jgi:hypothetical protein
MLLANIPASRYLLLARSLAESRVNNYQEVYNNVVDDKINHDDNFGTVPCCSSLNKHIMA